MKSSSNRKNALGTILKENYTTTLWWWNDPPKVEKKKKGLSLNSRKFRGLSDCHPNVNC